VETLHESLGRAFNDGKMKQGNGGLGRKSLLGSMANLYILLNQLTSVRKSSQWPK